MSLCKKFIALNVLIVVLTFFSCSTTSSEENHPIFSATAINVHQSVDSIIHFETINISGYRTDYGNKSQSEIFVKIVNGEGLPADENKRKTMSKTIAVTVKHALKNENQYDLYFIFFETKVVNDNATKRKVVGRETFRLDEL